MAATPPATDQPAFASVAGHSPFCLSTQRTLSASYQTVAGALR